MKFRNCLYNFFYQNNQ